MDSKPQQAPLYVSPPMDSKARNQLNRDATAILKHWNSQPFSSVLTEIPAELHLSRARLQEIDGFDMLRLIKQGSGVFSSII